MDVTFFQDALGLQVELLPSELPDSLLPDDLLDLCGGGEGLQVAQTPQVVPGKDPALSNALGQRIHPHSPASQGLWDLEQGFPYGPDVPVFPHAADKIQ